MFHRAKDIAFALTEWQFALYCLNHIFIFSKDPKDHVNDVHMVLRALFDVSVSLKLKNCSFLNDCLDYLSHVVRSAKLELASHKTEAICDLKNPKTVTELKSFLELCSVCLRFRPNLAQIAAPLNKILIND